MRVVLYHITYIAQLLLYLGSLTMPCYELHMFSLIKCCVKVMNYEDGSGSDVDIRTVGYIVQRH
jgi:hypothetical protein